MTEINVNKEYQRKISIKKRATLKDKNSNAFKRLQDHLKDLINFKNYKIIASFISFKSEISTQFLNEFLLNNGKILCLPIIKNNSETLNFIEYNLKTKLVSGKFDIMQPSDLSKELLPEIILTPCLAFDENGFRLGYGGGYYDKTFSYLKKIKHKFISIAVAFDDQKIDELVHDKYDQKIDYILTEKKLYKV
jgi:5-formyltetrahydrofolate cyclo-ligase